MAKKRSSSVKKNDVHELDILFPDRPVEIAGRSTIIKEYTFLDGLRLLTIVEPVIKALKEKYADIPSFEDASEILINHRAEVIFLISKACDLSIEEVSKATDEEGGLLLGLWWETNKHGLFDFFKESTSKKSTKKNTWTHNITYLLVNGFNLEEIKQLTLRQVIAFTQAISEIECSKMADSIIEVSVGTNGGKETAKIVKDLRK